ncbi:hypothetical protein C8F04DRAFT_1176770 [Mycena alexandri]|uniref:Uncharacterized protein n=1 Tax=Mycena alexandri TaxID=1745969 RepID=A0AAD6XAV3_9AGAR|nr:hypothetical protein C8F04DRAFT_1176770 [Mycena alexandri]
MARSGPSAQSAHAACNPGRQVQLSRLRTGKSRAVRASNDLRLASLRKRRNILNAAVDAEFLRCESALADIVRLSGKKASYVRSLLASTSQFKATRAPTLRNAVLHQRWFDRPEGCNKKLQEYREDLAEDKRLGIINLAQINQAERSRLLKQLVEHRQLKRNGICATTKVQQLNSVKTALRVENAIDDLFERTGVRTIAVFSCGKADDPTVPHVVDSDDASGFFIKVLGMSKVEFLRKFEAYNCSREDGTDEKNGVREMRKDGGSTLLEGFTTVTGKKQVKMEYLNYDVAIREAKGVELAGWPTNIKMVDHANWSAETLRQIRTTLHSGTIHWVRMTKTQHEELIARHNAQREALGAGSLKPRSDKGEARGPQKHKRKAPGKTNTGRRREEDDDDDDDEEDDSDKGNEEDDDATAPIERPGATSALTAPPTFTPGVGLTNMFTPLTLTAQHMPPPFDVSAHPQLQVLPDNLPSLSGDISALGIDLNPELLEMLADPTAWMPNEHFALPTDPASVVFAASFSLDTDPAAITTLASSNTSGSSKRKRVSQEDSNESAPPPKKRSKKAKGTQNTPPAEGEGEPVKKQHKKRSDAGIPKGPRKSK